MVPRGLEQEPQLEQESHTGSLSQAGKNTTIRRTAVLETDVSRHHGCPPGTPQISQHDGITRFKWGPQLNRETSVSWTADEKFKKKYFLPARLSHRRL